MAQPDLFSLDESELTKELLSFERYTSAAMKNYLTTQKDSSKTYNPRYINVTKEDEEKSEELKRFTIAVLEERIESLLENKNGTMLAYYKEHVHGKVKDGYVKFLEKLTPKTTEEIENCIPGKLHP
ncbi:uncharacterized protein [Clytia hemisphaerica]|uniref:uncharacterized protein n=1 Tax=Clytia hemisphaerica TaxID=252671 RepID=UPI0034D62019